MTVAVFAAHPGHRVAPRAVRRERRRTARARRLASIRSALAKGLHMIRKLTALTPRRTARGVLAVTGIVIAYTGAAVLDGGITNHALAGLAALAVLALGGSAHAYNLASRLARTSYELAATKQELAVQEQATREVNARLDGAGFPIRGRGYR